MESIAGINLHSGGGFDEKYGCRSASATVIR